MLLHTNKERAIYCYHKDVERLKRHVQRLIDDIKDYKENKDDYKEYVYDIRDDEYVKNSKFECLNIDLRELNGKLRACGYKEIENVCSIKDADDVIDYLEFLLER